MKQMVKKSAKKLACGVMAALLALQAVQMPANANVSAAPIEVEVTVRDSSIAGLKPICAGPVTMSEKLYAASLFEGVNYGEQLPTASGLSEAEGQDSKAIYDVLATVTPENTQLNVTLPVGFHIESASPVIMPEQQTALNQYIGRISQAAIDAFARDYPEKFWFSITGTGFSLAPNTSMSNKDGMWVADIQNIVISVAVNAGCVPTADYTARFEEAVEQMEVDTTDRYHLLKSIHDTICLNNVYVEDTYAHLSYGGMVTGKSVCEGYAKAFKVMCDKYDIPCVLITGVGINSAGNTEDHMWNAVQMEDGSWYGVDVTWDDSGTDQIFYDYFLAGEDTSAVHYGGKTFGESHQPDGDFNKTGIAEFVYPTLSKEAFEAPQDPFESEEPDPTEDVNPTETPAVSEDPQPAVVFGDVDDNASVDAGDALMILRAVVRLVELDQEQMYRADVDADHFVSAGDALMILRKVVKLIDTFPAEQQNQ